MLEYGKITWTRILKRRAEEYCSLDGKQLIQQFDKFRFNFVRCFAKGKIDRLCEKRCHLIEVWFSSL